jgi:hypothetical protein
MLTYPYLMVLNHDACASTELIALLVQAKEVHLVNFNQDIFQYRQKEQQFYQYCQSLEQMKVSLSHQVIPHLAFHGDTILNSDLLHVSGEFERFWFIDETVLAQDALFYAQHFKNYPYALCLSISPIFQPDINTSRYETYRQWIADFYRHIHNSLAQKEMELLQIEQFHAKNHLVIQKNNQVNEQPVVLGLFGDCPVDNMAQYSTINLKSIMKQKVCSVCEYQSYCLERGLGYIMNQFQFKGCIGIQLLEQPLNNLNN